MNIIPFQSPDFAIRAVDIDGEPWFVGKDVADMLGYADTVNAIKQHCKMGAVKHHPIADRMGRMQKVRLINEPDLFRLVVNSQLPSAERFERWVFEEVLPAIRKTGSYQARPDVPPVKQMVEAARAFAPLFRIARLFGCNKNIAAISANQAVMAATNVNLLQQLGHTHLVAENQQSLYHTPTELGQMMGGLSARAVNLLLADAGLQAKAGGHWQPLEAGRDFVCILDTGKHHGSGAPIQQLKWSATVLPLLDAAQLEPQAA